MPVLKVKNNGVWQEVSAAGGAGGSSINVDTSLTMSGAAADAKSVGDALANKSDNGHNHDDLYFTASEVDTKINTAVHTEQARAEGIEAGLRTDVDSIKANTLYATDTNKDGNVELFFGAKTIELITFELDYTSYQVEVGTTWKQWINSGNTPAELKLIVDMDNSGVYAYNGSYMVNDIEDVHCQGDDIIKANTSYYLV